jgi:hypothetical protein
MFVTRRKYSKEKNKNISQFLFLPPNMFQNISIFSELITRLPTAALSRIASRPGAQLASVNSPQKLAFCWWVKICQVNSRGQMQTAGVFENMSDGAILAFADNVEAVAAMDPDTLIRVANTRPYIIGKFV